ncbi:hypothetical protein A2954_04775 [Candidatus Roizmanbacteria bacterium RIFCSPLOWO2_01_FULL_37_12]|uniref:Uncharacterized protein n=1 Tax=Candidatus Roizmanbacteria bacterium RIFCSPLOWO2_01_FULL_37_12 TaxID=1802056 RepID=A0A1F7IG13_9BACT|nr:MAG: hypothetical protein A2768_00860 [Candidatus Roizmanbacteria bacterium RIFCSPHIGHO2_01_FULL_37_16]OGK24309.1 MAG: hypothetical protein A3D76_02615 [Candidatus Roizmanbacteria bacterium RIFCSPHIGHO2_02_FULL_37_9b]OGK42293.1 MAG: hypothetical protein A2954_04775 [Candidatus Roizmanbacteria bacterium RIFCSPLOWO2_01_FULL_37_12]
MKQDKFLLINGNREYLSPLILSGNLIVSGMTVPEAYTFSEKIISNIPSDGIKKDDFLILLIAELPDKIKMRFVLLELVKKYILSGKNQGPLFIFIGGMGGKTLLGNFISQQLGVNQAVAIDNEKYRLADPKVDQSYLWKATYESSQGYLETVKKLTPWMIKMIERNVFDFRRYKKWCYLWEGIYLSPQAVKNLYSSFAKIDFLSIFILPKFDDIKRQYLIRWERELGVKQLSKRKNLIDAYLQNIEAIRTHISKNIDPIASFVIDSPIFEERLSIFYALLNQKFTDIADREFPGWAEKVTRKPSELLQFNSSF